MPRGPTSRVINRKRDLLEIMKKYNEVVVSDLMEAMGLSRTQVMYTLKLLEKEGYVKGIKRGHVIFWRVIR